MIAMLTRSRRVSILCYLDTENKLAKCATQKNAPTDRGLARFMSPAESWHWSHPSVTDNGGCDARCWSHALRMTALHNVGAATRDARARCRTSSGSRRTIRDAGAPARPNPQQACSAFRKGSTAPRHVLVFSYMKAWGRVELVPAWHCCCASQTSSEDWAHPGFSQGETNLFSPVILAGMRAKEVSLIALNSYL